MVANVITKEMIEKYERQVKDAIDNLKISVPDVSALHQVAMDIVDMILSYYSDAKYFQSKEDYINAMGALYYAYGWIDCAVRLGLLDGGKDYTKFTQYK